MRRQELQQCLRPSRRDDPPLWEDMPTRQCHSPRPIRTTIQTTLGFCRCWPGCQGQCRICSQCTHQGLVSIRCRHCSRDIRSGTARQIWSLPRLLYRADVIPRDLRWLVRCLLRCHLRRTECRVVHHRLVRRKNLLYSCCCFCCVSIYRLEAVRTGN